MWWVTTWRIILLSKWLVTGLSPPIYKWVHLNRGVPLPLSRTLCLWICVVKNHTLTLNKYYIKSHFKLNTYFVLHTVIHSTLVIVNMLFLLWPFGGLTAFNWSSASGLRQGIHWEWHWADLETIFKSNVVICHDIKYCMFCFMPPRLLIAVCHDATWIHPPVVL